MKRYNFSVEFNPGQPALKLKPCSNEEAERAEFFERHGTVQIIAVEDTNGKFYLAEDVDAYIKTLSNGRDDE